MTFLALNDQDKNKRKRKVNSKAKTKAKAKSNNTKMNTCRSSNIVKSEFIEHDMPTRRITGLVHQSETNIVAKVERMISTATSEFHRDHHHYNHNHHHSLDSHQFPQMTHHSVQKYGNQYQPRSQHQPHSMQSHSSPNPHTIGSTRACPVREKLQIDLWNHSEYDTSSSNNNTGTHGQYNHNHNHRVGDAFDIMELQQLGTGSGSRSRSGSRQERIVPGRRQHSFPGASPGTTQITSQARGVSQIRQINRSSSTSNLTPRRGTGVGGYTRVIGESNRSGNGSNGNASPITGLIVRDSHNQNQDQIHITDESTENESKHQHDHAHVGMDRMSRNHMSDSSLQDDLDVDIVEAYDENEVDVELDPEESLVEPQDKKKKGSNYCRWDDLEEVYLIGTVVDKFLTQSDEIPSSSTATQGTLKRSKSSSSSLTPAGRTRNTAGLNLNDESWPSVKDNFDLAVSRFGIASDPKRTVNRTAASLNRHFKYLRQRLTKGLKKREYFHTLYDDWEELCPAHMDSEAEDIDFQERQLLEQQQQEANTNANANANTGLNVNSNKSSKGSREPKWEHIEDVFLIGVIMHRFLSFGSLCTQKKRSPNSINSPGDAEPQNSCWNALRELYKTASEQYDSSMMPRSAASIKARYKILRRKNARTNSKTTLKALFSEWRTVYNKEHRLLPLNA